LVAAEEEFDALCFDYGIELDDVVRSYAELRPAHTRVAVLTVPKAHMNSSKSKTLQPLLLFTRLNDQNT